MLFIVCGVLELRRGGVAGSRARGSGWLGDTYTHMHVASRSAAATPSVSPTSHSAPCPSPCLLGPPSLAPGLRTAAVWCVQILPPAWGMSSPRLRTGEDAEDRRGEAVRHQVGFLCNPAQGGFLFSHLLLLPPLPLRLEMEGASVFDSRILCPSLLLPLPLICFGETFPPSTLTFSTSSLDSSRTS